MRHEKRHIPPFNEKNNLNRRLTVVKLKRVYIITKCFIQSVTYRKEGENKLAKCFDFKQLVRNVNIAPECRFNTDNLVKLVNQNFSEIYTALLPLVKVY